MSPADPWKLVVAIALFGTVITSALARPPRRSTPAVELRRLVLAAIVLYGAGLAASLTRHVVVAVVLYSAGITLSALAGWLSRGADSSGPPRGEEPINEQPPPTPDDAPEFNWEAFERELDAYTRRGREPVGSG